MMRKGLFAFTVFLGIAWPVGPDQTYRFGPLGRRLTADDLTAISRLVTSGKGAPWALFGWYSQILPETWYADAFLAPTLSTGSLRRGEVLHLECRPARSDAPCLKWEVLPKAGTYVQVADGHEFDGALEIRRPSERPIQLHGDFADHEVVSLVRYTRLKPAPRAPDGRLMVGVSGTYPIMAIEQQRDGSVWVRMSDDGGVGETAIVQRTQRGWQITQVVFWVA